LYAAHVIQMYAFPNTAPLLRAFISAADYIGSTVLPYAGPVLAALGLHPDFRRRVIG
jgi:hypothetical protein